MDLVKTGIKGFDEILCGGLVPYNSYLLKGIPGSGKTTLGVETIINGIKRDCSGLIVTFEERPEKMYRDFGNFGWDLKNLEANNKLKVISSSPKAAKEMLSNSDSILSRYITANDIKLLLIDSISSFSRIEEDPIRLREIMQQFINSLITKEITPLFIMEMPQVQERNISFEEYLTDAVIQLSYEQKGERRRERFIEVLKTRSHKHLEGRHSMKITSRGINIFPSCQPVPKVLPVISPVSEKIKSGINGLDFLLGGGFPQGRSTLIAGSSGTGKTTIGIQFLAAGARFGQPGLFILSQESPSHLFRNSNSIGIDFQRLEKENYVHLINISPINLCVDELFYNIKEIILENRISRLVIDSISDLLLAIPDEEYMKEFMFSLTDFFRTQGITSMMTYDVGDMFGSFNLTHKKLPGLIDNLIFLRYVELEGEIARALSVLKMRGCQHNKGIHEIITTNSGLAIKERFEGREGLMAGTAKKSIIEMDEIINHVSRLEQAKKKFRTQKNKRF